MFRNIGIWIRPYLRQRLASTICRRKPEVRHVIFCIADHFEPLWSGADHRAGTARIERWIDAYERSAPAFRDSEGRAPKHTYFFPLEQHRPDFFNLLREHCRRGFGEVEFHLHHRNDTSGHLRETLERCRELYAESGFLGRDARGRARYGFVHGNWALDNSSPDGSWCGVNDELTILHDTGCYADFTLPSAPSPTQTSTINSIYYAIDDPLRPKSHDRGLPVAVGGGPPEGKAYLMIVQGILALDWRWRLCGLLPRIENSDLSAGHPPMRHRWRLWMGASVAVTGRPQWIFVKLHTHGCTDENFRMFFERDGFRELHVGLDDLRRGGGGVRCHYASAREMYNIIRAAEAGETGDPSEFRDYIIGPPACGRPG